MEREGEGERGRRRRGKDKRAGREKKWNGLNFHFVLFFGFWVGETDTSTLEIWHRHSCLLSGVWYLLCVRVCVCV